MNAALPIGVFDSGIGGLSVLKALIARLPREDFLYLGDTARLPYGTKTPATVERYALQAVQALVARGVKAVVVACNTASAAALPALAAAHPELPIIGVIEAGAGAAVAATHTGRIAVIATEGTVRGGAYQRAIAKLRPGAEVHAVPTTLFVALAEEGWTAGEVVIAAARRYLQPLLDAPTPPDVLVLGCTHFPPLAGALRSLTRDLRIVDSAEPAAEALAVLLRDASLLSAVPGGACRFLVTDGEERFARVGPVFLGRAIDAGAIERVNL